MKVFCYRNLHKKGVVWSVKDWKTKKVIDWVESIILENVELKVSQKGRERVIREKQKNVHAGILGTRIENIPDIQWVKATYNPYKYNSFMVGDKPVTVCKYAKLCEDGLFIDFNSFNQKPII